MSCSSTERVDDLQNGRTPAGSKVPAERARLGLQVVQRCQVAGCEVHDMDVVTYTGPVWRGVIVSEHHDFLAPPHRNLCNEGQKVVGDAAGVFADAPIRARPRG